MKNLYAKFLSKSIATFVAMIMVMLLSLTLDVNGQTIQIQNNQAYGDYWWTYPCGSASTKAQSFTTGTSIITVTSADVMLEYYSSGGTGNVWYEIWSNNNAGTPGTLSDDYPGTVITNGTSNTIAILTSWTTYVLRSCTFPASPVLASNTKYWIVAKTTATSVSVGYSTANAAPWAIEENDQSTGTACTAWSTAVHSGQDMIFDIYGTTCSASVTGTTPASSCGTGSVTLSATGSSGATLNWYDASSGGNFLGTGTSYTTPSISSTTTYYVDATNGCTSSRTAVVATIVPSAPAQPSAITGSATPSAGTSQTYSVTNVAGTTYTWSFPSGWTQTGGGTTNSVTVTVGIGSGTVTVTPSNICGNGTAQTLAVTTSLILSAATSGTWICPAGVTSATVQCWGAGGGGGSRSSGSGAYGGGGGGAYATNTVTGLVPGNSYPYTVGTGGTAGVTGGSSTFNTNVVIAVGGAGVAANTAAGGAGGLASACTPVTGAYSGGTGGTGVASSYSGGGGGGAGSTAGGGNASGQTAGIGTSLNGGNGGTGRTSNGNGAAGNNYGGGGAGGYRTSGSATGGTGAGGYIVITAILSNACSGTPTAGTATPSPSTITCSGTSVISVSGYSLDAGITFQWYSSTDNINFTLISGATTTTYTTPTLTATTYYYCIVTCSNSSQGATSSTATVTVNAIAPAAPVASAGTGATASSFNANWAVSSSATSYFLDVATDNGFVNMVTGYNNLNVGNVLTKSVTGLVYSTTYYYRVRAYSSCGTSGNSSPITYATTGLVYCTSSLYTYGCSSYNDYIDNISVADLTQTGTGCTGGTGLVDYTGTTVHFTQSMTYPFTITTGESGQWVGFWVDFDNNGSFGDAGEYIGGNTSASTLTTITANITIPAGATPGNHRMRVRLVWSTSIQSLSTSCTLYSFGETHDYTCNIAALVPPAITSLGSTSGCPGSSLTINGNDLSGATAANVTIGGTAVSSITSNTGTVMVVVTGSGTSGIVSVTTPGGTGTSGATTFTFITAPATPGAITSNSPQCVGTGVIFSKGACTEGSCYWVSGANGTETGNSAATYTSASTLGTYNVWVRAYNGCWSPAVTASGSVNTAPSAVTVTPSSGLICEGTVQSLVASGGIVSAIPIIELFNGATSAFTTGSVSGSPTSTQNTTYYSEGSSSFLFNTASTYADVNFTQTTAISLASFISGVLTFSHICATEASYDYGYVQYSTDNGSNWTSFPANSYTGSGTLKNSVVSFDKSSYTDWGTQFTSSTSTPGTGPAASLWKTETINIPAAALTSSQFKIRFRMTTDVGTNYYGWLLDNVKITVTGSSTMTWSPITGLYTNVGGTTPYAGTNLSTVYAKPTPGNPTYTATATSNGCSSSNTSTLTVFATVGTPVFALGATSLRCQGAGSVTYTATAAHDQGISYSLDGASVSGGNSINTATGEVTYVAGWTGSSTITCSASGCSGPKTSTHTVTTTPTVGTPVFALGATSTRCEAGGIVTYTATATNSTGITYALDSYSLSHGNTIVAGTGAVTYAANYIGSSVITATAQGCSGPTSATHTVTTNETPSAVTVTPSSAAMCNIDILPLTASGGTVLAGGSTDILTQGFNGTTNDWTTTNNSSGGDFALAAWTLQPNNYEYPSGEFWNSNDGTQFYLSNSDIAYPEVTETILQSPVFSTVGYTSVNLTFYHYFYWHAQSAKVQYSTDGTNWTTLKTYTATVGSKTGFLQDNIALPTGESTLYVRFKYDDEWGYQWAIDNVKVTGAMNLAPITWTSHTGLFTDAGAQSGYTGQELRTIYAHPQTTTTYTATATLGNCTSTATTTLTVTTLPVATFSYANTPYCSNATNPLPTYSGGGVAGAFTSTGGLVFTVTPGQVNLSGSTAGSYTVTNTIAAGVCPEVTATAPITITTLPTASISYAGTPFCKTVSSGPVTLTGTDAYSGGAYTASPSGLSIVSGTGEIDPSASIAGSYTVTYTIPASGGCAAIPVTTSVTITALPIATFSYAGTPYCSNAANPLPTYSGGGIAGAFTSTSGLAFTGTPGQVNLSGSTAGSYTVTNTIAAGVCPEVTATAPITITTLPTASISYTGTPFCKTVSSGPVTLTGTDAYSGGTYSASPSGLSIVSGTGEIDPSASTAGTYTVTYTIPASGGCAAIPVTTSVTITALPIATFEYTGTPYCSNASNPLPHYLGGGVAGVFTASPSDIAFVSTTTGQVNLLGSTAGSYTITNTIAASAGCPDVIETAPITITTLPTASISYTGSPWCSTEGTKAVNFTGTPGGLYTASPAGLSIDDASGLITPGTSSAGTYTVTYTIDAAGGCATVTATTGVTVTELPTAEISYSDLPWCKTATAQTVTLVGTTGGVYSSDGELAINTATGEITPGSSSAGTHTVTYTIAAAGGCAAVTATTDVTITALPTAAISYAGTPFCITDGSSQSVSLVGTLGGAYSSDVDLAINATSGAITPNLSLAGLHTVTYTIAAAGGCAAVTATTDVTVTELPTATISYTGSPWCETATAQTVTLVGNSGGVYSSDAELAINASTGEITPGSSAAGLYTVTYTIAAAGGCAAVTATTDVTITALPTAAISYAGTPFCITDGSSQSVSLVGTLGGAYSSDVDLSLNASSGDITPSGSTAGLHTVTYTIAAAGGCAAVTATTDVTVTELPTAAISYTGSPWCTTATTQTVDLIGTSGGVYSSDINLTIGSANGLITPATSGAGLHTVTYTIAAAGGCAAVTATTDVTITALPTAAISYAGTPFCITDGSSQSVSLVGTLGGAYSSDVNLSLNASTGDITPSGSTAGLHTVTYTIAAAGGCAAVTATTDVTITALPVASFSYTGSPYLSNATNPFPSLDGVAGVFSSTTGLVFVSDATGEVDLAGSTPGTYTVTNTIAAAGGCDIVTATSDITINAFSKTLDITILVEGLYTGGVTMHEASDESYGPKWGVGVADVVTVELHSTADYSLVESYPGNLLTDGHVIINTVAGVLSGDYYITVLHRNSVPVTTALPVSFAGISVSYDFTSSATQAYGTGAQKDLGSGIYGMYTGEVNHDGPFLIDGDDIVTMLTAIPPGLVGYYDTDLNGNGLVDGNDLVILLNNIPAGVYYHHP